MPAFRRNIQSAWLQGSRLEDEGITFSETQIIIIIIIIFTAVKTLNLIFI
jgi:hypothetical protein